MILNVIRQKFPWRQKSAFTLLETLVMMAALFVVTMLVAGVLKLQWPEVFGSHAVPVQAETPVKP